MAIDGQLADYPCKLSMYAAHMSGFGYPTKSDIPVKELELTPHPSPRGFYLPEWIPQVE
jgi:hypothetical protein